jgi:hypothetical protein
MGADKITLFESTGEWGHDLTAPCRPAEEFSCRLDIDLSRRAARLTVNEKSLDLTCSENVTSINYIGFGAHHSETLFTSPVLTRH